VQAQSSHSQKVLSHSSLDQAGSGAAAHGAPSPAHALLQSSELLKGQKTIGILHNGSLYRLQTTKLGKLILTK
jgi:hemin uptake protein HemP